ncbi:hypothetical protein PoB_001233600 [Plakobranchus ocellatus]|uniref:Uncharacterized protein n=1 Tax=Plakobranchus ocellatus TaxID=259542 RepID=A0AAV3YR77_9GAST|nr:hypothetical protein PoB_001233600 [Plakobranchus ocellatus]
MTRSIRSGPEAQSEQRRQKGPASLSVTTRITSTRECNVFIYVYVCGQNGGGIDKRMDNALHKARAPVAGSNPPQKGLCRSRVGSTIHYAPNALRERRERKAVRSEERKSGRKKQGKRGRREETVEEKKEFDVSQSTPMPYRTDIVSELTYIVYFVGKHAVSDTKPAGGGITCA